jgi:hypothetical protein
MADFSLRLVVNTHTIKTRTKPPTTPKIMGVLFEDLSLLLTGGVSTGGGASSVELTSGVSLAGGASAVELMKGDNP